MRKRAPVTDAVTAVTPFTYCRRIPRAERLDSVSFAPLPDCIYMHEKCLYTTKTEGSKNWAKMISRGDYQRSNGSSRWQRSIYRGIRASWLQSPIPIDA